MQDQILNALKVVNDPDLNRNIVDLGFVRTSKPATASFRSPSN
jgi:metal-sulfur cluster biosynthetic enzyme